MKTAWMLVLVFVGGYSSGLLLEAVAFGEESKFQNLITTGQIDSRWLPFTEEKLSDVKSSILNYNIDSAHMSFVKNAEMAMLIGMIDKAQVDFTISLIEVENPYPHFRNEITECIFQSDDTLNFSTCVICQLKDIDDLVAADGRKNLPGGYVANSIVTVPITNFYEQADRNVKNIHGVIIAVCGEEGGEGCTPGFWKQPQHFFHWANFEITDKYLLVFGISAITIKEPDNSANSNPTLLEALKAQGGAQNALARHSVAALLNADSSVSFGFTTGEVIALVQDAFSGMPTNSFEEAKNLLAAENELGCPLSGQDPGDPNVESFSETGGVDSTTYDGSTATPYEKKQYSLQQLNILVTDPGISQGTIDLLNAAIIELNEIVNTENYWVDDYHIDIVTGQSILYNSEQATTTLITVTNSAESQTFKDSVQLVIDELVAADSILAQTAVNDVGACGGKNNKIDGHLANAQTKLNQAQQDTNDKKYDLAIQKFYDAWNEAFLATESCPTGYWTELYGYEVVI